MSTHTKQPVENIATKPVSGHQPPLRKSVSRVLSRVMSITRKDTQQQEEQVLRTATSRAVFKAGHERAVHIERGYEVIPRVTSTHLKRGDSGLREVSLNVPIGTESSTTSSRGKEYPFYSHPQLPSHIHAAGTQPGPRRPSITTKLSRNQIANFRRASTSSQTSVYAPAISILSKRDDPTLSRRPAADRRRHLASSRSTLEMRGRSSGESTRPSTVSSFDDLTSTPTANRRAHRPSPSDGASPVPFVCPDKLIQRARAFTPSPDLQVLRSDSPAFARQLPPTPQSRGSSHRKPVPPMFDASPCSTNVIAASPVTPGEMSNEGPLEGTRSLEQLFDEVMSACQSEVAATAEVAPEVEEEHVSLLRPNGFDALTPTKPLTSQSTGMQRFIPSGRSFEPLRQSLVQPRVVFRSMEGVKSMGKATRQLAIGGKVKEAIAKFERQIVQSDSPGSKPSTPVRVLGDILDRPGSVSSAGLSSESRRMSKLSTVWEARQQRGIR